MRARTPLNDRDRALMLQFGATIRHRRQEVGLNQEALAHRAGHHRTYLASVEKGGRNVALSGIARITQALGLSLSELYRLIERSAGKLPAKSRR